MLNQKDLRSITRQLEAHRAALQAQLQGLRRNANNELYPQAAGLIHDPVELSATLRKASLGRETEALQDTEEALQRLRTNTYGRCADCGQIIERKRLLAYPIAKRCLQCLFRY